MFKKKRKTRKLTPVRLSYQVSAAALIFVGVCFECASAYFHSGKWWSGLILLPLMVWMLSRLSVKKEVAEMEKSADLGATDLPVIAPSSLHLRGVLQAIALAVIYSAGVSVGLTDCSFIGLLVLGFGLGMALSVLRIRQLEAKHGWTLLRLTGAPKSEPRFFHTAST